MLRLLACGLVLAGCQSDAEAPGPPPGTLTVDGQVRTYHYVPAQGNAGPPPLVVALHGGQSTGLDFERQTGLSQVAPGRGVAVVYPDAIGRVDGDLYWNDGRLGTQVDDLRFITALVADLVQRRAADPARVYLTGFSNGAGMANKLATERTATFAAVAPVAGTLSTRLAPALFPPPLPVLYFHGTADPFAFYTEGGSIGTAPGGSLPAEAYVAWWAQRNGCQAGPVRDSLPDAAADGTTVVRWTYAECTNGVQVQFYQIVGGGHQWPSGQVFAPTLAGPLTREVDANQQMLDFFLRFRR